MSFSLGFVLFVVFKFFIMRCFTALCMTSPRVISSPICSVRYIIPSIRRASTLIVTMKDKKMVHYMHIIPYSGPTFMHLCDKS